MCLRKIDNKNVFFPGAHLYEFHRCVLQWPLNLWSPVGHSHCCFLRSPNHHHLFMHINIDTTVFICISWQTLSDLTQMFSCSMFLTSRLRHHTKNGENTLVDSAQTHIQSLRIVTFVWDVEDTHRHFCCGTTLFFNLSWTNVRFGEMYIYLCLPVFYLKNASSKLRLSV